MCLCIFFCQEVHSFAHFSTPQSFLSLNHSGHHLSPILSLDGGGNGGPGEGGDLPTNPQRVAAPDLEWGPPHCSFPKTGWGLGKGDRRKGRRKERLRGSLVSWVLAAPSGEEDVAGAGAGAGPSLSEHSYTSQTRSGRHHCPPCQRCGHSRAVKRLAQVTQDMAGRAGIPCRPWTLTLTP